MELEVGSALASFACVLELAVVWVMVMGWGAKVWRVVWVLALVMALELGLALVWVVVLVVVWVWVWVMVLALVWAMELVWVWVMELVLAWKSRRYKTLHSKGHFQRQRRCKRLRQRSR